MITLLAGSKFGKEVVTKTKDAQGRIYPSNSNHELSSSPVSLIQENYG